MFRKLITLIPAALLGALPFAASAESLDRTELEMFRSASLTLQQAGETALKAHAGTLSSVSFGDENGRGAYEAIVIGSDGEPWTVLIDAKTGEVFASEKSSAMKEHEDAKGEQGENGDGETNG